MKSVIPLLQMAQTLQIEISKGKHLAILSSIASLEKCFQRIRRTWPTFYPAIIMVQSVLHHVAWFSKSEPRHMFAYAGLNDVYSLFARGSLGKNALHFASQRGNLALIRNLLDLPYNISIDSPDLAGQTALYHAVQNKQVDAVSTLIKAMQTSMQLSPKVER